MADITFSGTPELVEAHPGQRGYRAFRGIGIFNSTDANGTLPAPAFQYADSVICNAVGAGNAFLRVLGKSFGTTSATAAGDIIVPTTGLITSAYIISATTENATDDTDYWTVGLVNSTATLTPVDSTTAANTSKNTGGAAITADTKRSLTLGAAAQLVVTAGDVLKWTFTKGGSGAALNFLEAYITYTYSGTDEVVYCSDTVTNGRIAPTSNRFTIARSGASKTSALKFSFLITGR